MKITKVERIGKDFFNVFFEPNFLEKIFGKKSHTETYIESDYSYIYGSQQSIYYNSKGAKTKNGSPISEKIEELKISEQFKQTLHKPAKKFQNNIERTNVKDFRCFYKYEFSTSQYLEDIDNWMVISNYTHDEYKQIVIDQLTNEFEETLTKIIFKK